MKNLCLILTLIFSVWTSTSTFSAEKKREFKKSRRSTGPLMSDKWYKLNNLLNEEIKTINALGPLGPRLKFRLIELYSEQVKLIKEKENAVFLKSIGSKKRRKKSAYFRKSRALFLKTQKMGLKLIKRYPRFKYKGSLFYTLALNSRDFGGDKNTEYFLINALKFTPKGLPKVHNIKTTLAEFYYNNKKYDKAIRYYNDVLANTRDEWHSKHLFNASWCHFKKKNYDKAIELIKNAYKYGSHKKYVSLRDQVLDSIGLFHIFAKRAPEGVEFYLTHVEKPVQYLVKMAKKTTGEGSFKDTRFILVSALKNAKAKKQTDEQIMLHLNEMEIYRTFKQYELFFNVSLALEKIHLQKPLKAEERDDAVKKIKSLVGFQQVRLTKNLKMNVEDHDPKKRKRVLKYFDILASFEPQNRDQYHYLQGETTYALGLYKMAASYYQKGFEFSKMNSNLIVKTEPTTETVKKKPSKEFLKLEKEKLALKRKLMDSLLAVLEKEALAKKEQTKLTKYTFENHLVYWPVDKRSQKLYPKLFNLYLSEKNTTSSLRILELYVKNYKKDREKQRAMLTRQIDLHIKAKDSDRLAFWINKIQGGYLSFKPDYIEKATLVLGGLLFQGFQKLEDQGKKEEALEGYISLYNNEKYPKDIKGKSALRSSLIHLKLGDIEKSYEWMNHSLTQFNSKKAFEQKDKMIAAAQRYSLLQNFKYSSLLSTVLLKRFCAKKFKEKESLYTNSVYHQLLENNLSAAMYNQKLGAKCNISNKYQDDLALQIVNFLSKNRKYRSFFKFYSPNQKRLSLEKPFTESMLEMYWDTRYHGLTKLNSSLKRLLQQKETSSTLSKKLKTQISQIFSFEAFEKKYNNYKIGKLTLGQKFDQNLYNKELEGLLLGLKKLTENAKPLLASGNPNVMLGVYVVLTDKTAQTVKKIQAYTPNGVPKEFVQGFKNAMMGLTKPLHNQTIAYKAAGNKIISKNKIFSLYNTEFGNDRSLRRKVGFRYPASYLSSPIDTERGIK
ncbi:MAG: hypothetical protein CME70_17615 [Halobacteriovorax sp.]|nr:hypothetical protein [Halobacteriovorax sp.]